MDNSRVDDYQDRAREAMRVAEEFAAKGDYQQAIYRLTDALSHMDSAIGELKHRTP